MLAASESADVLIVGGGPAGLAAAVQARSLGLGVTLVDERSALGGRTLERPGLGALDRRAPGRGDAAVQQLVHAAQRSGARLLTRTACVGLDGTEAILVECDARARTFSARHVILAPGADDRPVVFPGWTLPGVISASLLPGPVETHRASPGTRVVVAGGGPVAAWSAAQLHRHGVAVVAVLDAARPPGLRELVRLAASARGSTSLFRAAVADRLALARARVPVRSGRIVIRAEGTEPLEAVVHAACDGDWRPVRGTEERLEVDALCVAYGVVPAVELLRVAGCGFGHDETLGGPAVIVDDWLRTTAPGISAAGGATGVHGAHVAIDEGRLAALGIVHDESGAAPIRVRLRRRRRFQEALRRTFAVGAGVYELATPDTIVCPCEHVTRAALEDAMDATSDVNVLKGLTRAMMGPCQGRRCQRQVAALLAARHGLPPDDTHWGTPRMPVRPVALGALADATVADPGLFLAH